MTPELGERVVYGLVLLTVVGVPPGVVFWFVVHPFARFWRRVGPWGTYIVASLAMAVTGWGLWLVHEPLLSVRFEYRGWVAIVGGVIYAGAIALALARRRQLTFRILAGLPEVAPERAPSQLLDQGIYGRIRHPRYVEFTLGVLAFACFTQYLATWAVALAMIPLLRLVVVFEERELVERFGDAYVEYARRVPRFVPRWRP